MIYYARKCNVDCTLCLEQTLIYFIICYFSVVEISDAEGFEQKTKLFKLLVMHKTE